MTDQPDPRTETLHDFADLTGLDEIRGLIQRGREDGTATFHFHFTDGRTVRVGGADTLYSQTKLNRVFAVSLGTPLRPMKPADFRGGVDALIRFATDVHETPDEGLAAQVRNWLDLYIDDAASTDRDGAAAQREPFTDNKTLYVSADHLARWIRRQYSEQVKTSDVRQALAEIGFAVTKVSYDRGPRNNRRRTSASYYSAPADILTDPEPDE